MANPLQLGAIPFLEFYAGLWAGVVFAVLLLRGTLKGWGKSPTADEPDLLEIAYLAGGFQRMAQTVMVALMASDAAKYQTTGGLLTIDTANRTLPREIEPLREHLSGLASRSDLTRALRPWLEKVRARMVQRGLTPHPHRLCLLRVISLLLVAVPLWLGWAKLNIGLDQVDLLDVGTILFLIFLVAVLARLVRAPFGTWSGDGALSRCRLRHADMLAKPETSDLPLAFAIGGGRMLWDSPLYAFGRAVDPGDD